MSSSPHPVISELQALFLSDPSEPEPFPNPNIDRNARIIPAAIHFPNRGEVHENCRVLQSAHGFYEFGREIKQAIFGSVLHAYMVVKVDPLTLPTYHLLRNPNDVEHFVRIEHKECAIKIYSRRRLRELQGRVQENPLIEITALQYLSNRNPYIIKQIDCCADVNQIYSIMEYFHGSELFDFISDQGPMTNDEAKIFFRQILEAVSYIHSLGIGHRDMSMENILFNPNVNPPHAVIIDFGMSLRLKYRANTPELLANITEQHAIHFREQPQLLHHIQSSLPLHYHFLHRRPEGGKKNYIAPEAFGGAHIFNPMLGDIWALGIILFMVLTGIPLVDCALRSDQRYLMVINNRLDVLVRSWGLTMIDPLCVDLIQRILRENPLERLTIPEILAHPWLNS